MLASSYRFHGYGSLKYVYKKGDVYRSRILHVKTTSNQRRNKSRVAVVVSKKVNRSAVGRNRIRRRVYEIVRSELDSIVGVHDIVVIVVSAEVRTMDHSEVVGTIQHCFRQAGLYRNTSKNGTIAEIKEINS